MAKTPSMWDLDHSVDSFFNRLWEASPVEDTAEPVIKKA